MRLLVLGATGGIGREMVRQAVERGHSVTALVRSPEGLKEFEGRIRVDVGNLLDASQLAAAMHDQDAVLSGFGPRLPIAKADSKLLRDFAGALCGAMRHADVKRVVVVSTAFLFKDSIVPPAYLFGRLLFPGVVKDATEMERTIVASGLDWTIVRPPKLTDKAGAGKYRVRVGHLPRFGFSISRADVADCMIRLVENNSNVRDILGVCD